MKIVGIASTKQQADELEEITKVFVVACRTSTLAIKSREMNDVALFIK